MIMQCIGFHNQHNASFFIDNIVSNFPINCKQKTGTVFYPLVKSKKTLNFTETKHGYFAENPSFSKENDGFSINITKNN